MDIMLPLKKSQSQAVQIDTVLQGISHQLKDGLVNLHPSTSVGMQNSFAIPRFLYAKLLCLLTELRTLNVENTKEIIHMHNRSANSVSPLLQELVS